VTGANPNVTVVTSDNNDTNPGSKDLLNGTTRFWVNLVTASTATITASGGGYTSSTSPMISVYPGSAVKLLALLPGESPLPNSSLGKTGTAAVQTAGAVFP